MDCAAQIENSSFCSDPGHDLRCTSLGELFCAHCRCATTHCPIVWPLCNPFGPCTQVLLWTDAGRELFLQVWKEIAALRILNLLSSILFVSVQCMRPKVCHESQPWARSAPKVSWKSDAISWRKSSLSWKSETQSEARNPTARAPHHIRQREREITIRIWNTPHNSVSDTLSVKYNTTKYKNKYNNIRI